MAAIVHQFMCLDDNFGVLVHDTATGATASIDVPEAGPVLNALSEKGWTLTHILVTHHHKDHIGGVDEVRARFQTPKSSARRQTRRVCPVRTSIWAKAASLRSARCAPKSSRRQVIQAGTWFTTSRGRSFCSPAIRFSPWAAAALSNALRRCFMNP